MLQKAGGEVCRKGLFEYTKEAYLRATASTELRDLDLPALLRLHWAERPFLDPFQTSN